MVYFFPTIQGYNKEKIPKGKSGPQPDLKIKKVCASWDNKTCLFISCKDFYFSYIF